MLRFSPVSKIKIKMFNKIVFHQIITKFSKCVQFGQNSERRFLNTRRMKHLIISVCFIKNFISYIHQIKHNSKISLANV